MKQIPIKLGPLALLLTLISICLTMLAILNYTTARADLRLAERYADTVRTRYALEAEGQEYLSGLRALPAEDAAALAEEKADADGVVWTTFEKDGSRLLVGVRLEAGEPVIEAWRHDRIWEQDEDMTDLWEGPGL